MNAATLEGFRKLAATMHAEAAERLTAREMAMTPHRLGRTGDKATTADGLAWYWSPAAEVWIRS
jgi:hypothetical protein